MSPQVAAPGPVTETKATFSEILYNQNIHFDSFDNATTDKISCLKEQIAYNYLIMIL